MEKLQTTATVLIVPGLRGHVAEHWQTLLAGRLAKVRSVPPLEVDGLCCNARVEAIQRELEQVDGPVLLAAHSLGCHAVAWWAALACEGWSEKIAGALLVAPPEVDEAAIDSRLHGFAPLPRTLLPFRSILVASRDDPYMRWDRARHLAKSWGSQFADAGEVGHINAQSGLGDWAFGRFLLSRFSQGGHVTRAESLQSNDGRNHL